ncbi:MAG: 50S ribosomal protein L6 [Candidatus Eisenbacteria bacterium]|nr:50S ribosomal protein L6 [Candidatus Eisenbacteria bacterium]
MSRIGRMPIPIPKGVEVQLEGRRVVAKGKAGQLEWTVVPELEVVLEEGVLHVRNPKPSKRTNSLWGTTRTVLNNMVLGLGEGFMRTLEVVGTGYRAEMKGKNTLSMELGLDHPITYTVPEGIDVEIKARPLQIILRGIDKRRVGHVAAEIRALKKPEPYHGKGIRFVGEYVRRKAGKAGA